MHRNMELLIKNLKYEFIQLHGSCYCLALQKYLKHVLIIDPRGNLPLQNNALYHYYLPSQNNSHAFILAYLMQVLFSTLQVDYIHRFKIRTLIQPLIARNFVQTPTLVDGSWQQTKSTLPQLVTSQINMTFLSTGICCYA